MAPREGSLLGTILVIGLAAVGAGVAIDATYQWSRDRVAAHERAAVTARLSSVLDPALLGQDLTTTQVAAHDETLLGSPSPVDAFVVDDGTRPAATVLSVVAPLGYNGPIQLLVGISPQGVVTGVRAVRHRETVGLGDAIDVAKSTWIRQFDARALVSPEPALWALRQDDGAFDAISGATVTSRAVVTAVKNALLYFEQHRDELYAAAAAEPREDSDRDD
jgi:electron transport complex protein RnfG